MVLVYIDEYHFYQPKRSSSLRKGITPPGTPNVKKVVRFADALGLDLASVRHVFDLEQPPCIPNSATNDLLPVCSGSDSFISGDENSTTFTAEQPPTTVYTARFLQPSASSSFMHRVLQDNICLENATIDNNVLSGFIKVKNISFHKQVKIRVTYNSWFSFLDSDASYVSGFCDGVTDRFSFSILIPPNLSEASKIQFAIHFCTDSGEEFWDSNMGQNYVYDITKSHDAPLISNRPAKEIIY